MVHMAIFLARDLIKKNSEDLIIEISLDFIPIQQDLSNK